MQATTYNATDMDRGTTAVSFLSCCFVLCTVLLKGHHYTVAKVKSAMVMLQCSVAFSLLESAVFIPDSDTSGRHHGLLLIASME